NVMAPVPCCVPVACREMLNWLLGSTEPRVAERLALPETLACQVRSCPPVLLTVSVTAAPLHGSTTLPGRTARGAGAEARVGATTADVPAGDGVEPRPDRTGDSACPLGALPVGEAEEADKPRKSASDAVTASTSTRIASPPATATRARRRDHISRS